MAEVRLIDANALREKVNNCFEDVFNGSVSASSDFITFAKFVDKLIDKAPTVENTCPYLSDDEVKQPCLQAPCKRPQGKFSLEDFKRFVESKIDMQDLYLPAHLFMLLDEYLDMRGGGENE